MVSFDCVGVGGGGVRCSAYLYGAVLFYAISRFPRCDLLCLLRRFAADARYSGLVVVMKTSCPLFFVAPCVIGARNLVRAPPLHPKREYFLYLSLALAVYFIGGLTRPPTYSHYCKRSNIDILGSTHTSTGHTATNKGYTQEGVKHLVIVTCIGKK